MTTRPYRFVFLAASVTLALTSTSGTPAFAEDDLGRLFFTPEKRQALDHQRQFNIQEKVETQQEPTFTINGVVTRSSGKRTVWVNGVAAGENDASAGIGVAPERSNPGRVVIQAGESSASSAKVGETIRRDTGDTADLLNGGRIVVRRPSPSR